MNSESDFEMSQIINNSQDETNVRKSRSLNTEDMSQTLLAQNNTDDADEEPMTTEEGPVNKAHVDMSVPPDVDAGTAEDAANKDQENTPVVHDDQENTPIANDDKMDHENTPDHVNNEKTDEDIAPVDVDDEKPHSGDSNNDDCFLDTSPGNSKQNSITSYRSRLLVRCRSRWSRITCGQVSGLETGHYRLLCKIKRVETRDNDTDDTVLEMIVGDHTGHSCQVSVSQSQLEAMLGPVTTDYSHLTQSLETAVVELGVEKISDSEVLRTTNSIINK